MCLFDMSYSISIKCCSISYLHLQFTKVLDKISIVIQKNICIMWVYVFIPNTCFPTYTNPGTSISRMPISRWITTSEGCIPGPKLRVLGKNPLLLGEKHLGRLNSGERRCRDKCIGDQCIWEKDIVSIMFYQAYQQPFLLFTFKADNVLNLPYM